MLHWQTDCRILFQVGMWDDARKRVDLAHRNFPTQLPYVAFISSDGVKDNGDSLHFDTDGAKELGRRYAQAYLDLQRK